MTHKNYQHFIHQLRQPLKYKKANKNIFTNSGNQSAVIDSRQMQGKIFPNSRSFTQKCCSVCSFDNNKSRKSVTSNPFI